MALNQYYKNFILWGEVDFHCLICEESFQELAELDRHIRWENHRKVLKAQVKSHKFKKEVIYQIRSELYYCEFCNYVSSTEKIDDMTSHIASEEHKNNKKKPKTDAEVTITACKRDGEYVTVNDVIVEEKDWNLVTHIENLCLVCGVFIPIDYSYVKDHIKAPKHVINLIGSKLVVEKDRFYRKLVSIDSFYCLCCKEKLSMSVFEGHWTSKEHCEFRKDPIFKTTYANANAARAIEEKKKKLERSLIVMHQKAHYDILEEKETAICKTCQYVVKLDFKIMNDHKKSHDNDVNKPVTVVETAENGDSSSEEDTYEVVFCELTDHGQRRRELSKYGKGNYIKLNAGGSKGYCSLCSTTISGHLKLFKEHVNGARHKGHLELKGLKKAKTHQAPTEKFKPITEFINNLYFAEDLKLLCINREVCIDVHSFILVYEIDKRFQYKSTKCLVCDVLYPYSFDFEHYGTEEHKKRFLSAKVLPREGEFVREIRPDVYHCGICNKIYPFWELMEKHLLSKPHIDNKNVNKYKVFEQKTFDETEVKTSRKTPDILYLQLLSIGIVKSKGVLSAEDLQVTHCCFQSLYAMQAANAGIHNLDPMQLKNADVQSVNASQAEDAGGQSIKVVQVTNGDGPSVNDMQVTNAGIQSVNAMQVKNAGIQTVNAMQATTATIQT